MPPNLNETLSLNHQKIDSLKNDTNVVKMIQQMHKDGYNLMALISNPSEPKYEKMPNKLNDWQKKTSEELHQIFNIQSTRVGIRLGRQLNGHYIVSIDFDCYSKDGANPITITACDEYLATIDRKDGMYSSSTEGNYNVLVDITDVPEILNMCESYPTNHWDSDHIQFLVQQKAQQVIPPTASTNKITEKMGKPRKFLNDVFIYKLKPDDAYMIGFFHKHYVAYTKTVIKTKTAKPVRPVATVEQETEINDEYTELLFDVIKNEVVENQYVINYNQWMGIGTILKHNNYPFSVFHKWHLMCLKNRDDGSAEHCWENIKGSGFHITALQGIAKKINMTEYKIWFVKHKKFLSVKTLFQGENDVAKFMTPIMKEHIVWTGSLWYRNNGQLWLPTKEAPVATIANQLQKIIDLSRETLMSLLNDTEDEEEKKALDKKIKNYGDFRWSCQGSGFTSHIAKMFKEYLFDDQFEKKINDTKYKIVYQNGIYDMKTKIFRKGIFPFEYITKTLPYDYEKGNEEIKREILHKLFRICNKNKEHLDYYLSTFGYTLTGDSSKEQIMWYMCGQVAKNGKSSVLEALCDILPIYAKSESRDNFYKNDTKLHKAVGTWTGMRLVWVNELEDDKKVNEALFKAVCDGTKIPFSKHFGENEIMPIGFKLYLVSNYQFNIKMDEGVKRRFKHCQFNSWFNIEDDTPEDEEKCIFRQDKDFAGWLKENKHSLLEILYEYSYLYTQRGLPKCPKEWEEKKQETIDNLNEFEANLRALCVIGATHSAWNEDLLEALEIKDCKEIKAEMKRLGLFHKYDSQFKSKGKKGLHTGLKLKTQEELNADQEKREKALKDVVVANASEFGNPESEYY